MTDSNPTMLLERLNQGDPLATAELFPLVYEELRQLSAQFLAGEAASHTLQPTALANEAYLRLIGPDGTTWANHRHFFGAAAQAIRRILIEHARSKRRIKRGGGARRINLDDLDIPVNDNRFDLLALDDAMNRLSEYSPEKAKLVELKFFGGLSVEEIAQALEVSESTVAREWRFARAWLHRALQSEPRS